MAKKVTKRDSLTNFKKARSLLDKIISMVEHDEYCIDTMQQNLAVIGLLKSAHRIMMENHLQSCFSEALDSKQTKKKQEMLEEILTVTKMLSK